MHTLFQYPRRPFNYLTSYSSTQFYPIYALALGEDKLEFKTARVLYCNLITKHSTAVIKNQHATHCSISVRIRTQLRVHSVKFILL